MSAGWTEKYLAEAMDHEWVVPKEFLMDDYLVESKVELSVLMRVDMLVA